MNDDQIIALRLAARPLALSLSGAAARIEGPSAESVRALLGTMLEANAAGAIGVPRPAGKRWRIELPAAIAKALPFLAWAKSGDDNRAGEERGIGGVRPHYLRARSRSRLLRQVATFYRQYGAPRHLPRLERVRSGWRFLIPPEWVLRMARAANAASGNTAGQDEGGFDIPDVFCMPGFHPEGFACVADDNTDVAGEPPADIDCQPPFFLDSNGNCVGPNEADCPTGFHLSSGFCCQNGTEADLASQTCKPVGGGQAVPPGPTPQPLPVTPTPAPPPVVETSAPWSTETKYAVGAVAVVGAVAIGIALARKKKRGRK